MNEVVIRVENVSKEYRLGVIGYGTLSKDLQSWWAQFCGKEDPNEKIDQSSQLCPGSNEQFWALKNVSFDVHRGEVIGIIGRNGAGKSTLLKILSRVTTPTSGSVKVKGRIASLLEVGTGFHPELTGRENVFLNGAILGMTRREVEVKFDEIVQFAEIEKFIDTPVKRYSSGMYVRLAFAVAAHLEPEILLVDEVLAVGDIEFQKKCIGKMGDVAGEGRTVLFVSHNIGAIKKLCNTSILIEKGELKFQGNTEDVIDHYLNQSIETEMFKPFFIKELDLTITNIALNKDNGGLITPFNPLKIDIEIESQRNVTGIGIQVMISHDDIDGLTFSTNTKVTKNLDICLNVGKNILSCIIDQLNLCSGRYWLGFGIDLPFIKFYYIELTLFSFNVEEVILEPGTVTSLPAYGHFYLKHKWIYQSIK